jgi:nucleoside-diphosphate-sugar epimerase
MKILVTGNMGYVGPVVVRRLRTAFPDAEIVGFDIGYFSSCLTGQDVLPECLLDAQIFGDVRDFDPAMLVGTDAIVHLAAISNDPISNEYERVTYDINHVATSNLAATARERGVKTFVFASSCSMYGFAADGARTEISALNPLTPYAKSKVLAERDLAQLAGPGFRVICLRFATACGMSPRLRLDLVLNDFVACAVAGETISVLSDGTPWRPLVNVHDMARAFEWALDCNETTDHGNFLVINVGSDAGNCQVGDLARAAAEDVENCVVSINQNAPPDRRSYRVDFSRFRALASDHQPQVDLAASIRELREGLEKMKFGDSKFRESGLMRINHLTTLRRKGVLDENLRWA